MPWWLRVCLWFKFWLWWPALWPWVSHLPSPSPICSSEQWAPWKLHMNGLNGIMCKVLGMRHMLICHHCFHCFGTPFLLYVKWHQCPIPRPFGGLVRHRKSKAFLEGLWKCVDLSLISFLSADSTSKAIMPIYSNILWKIPSHDRSLNQDKRKYQKVLWY